MEALLPPTTERFSVIKRSKLPFSSVNVILSQHPKRTFNELYKVSPNVPYKTWSPRKMYQEQKGSWSHKGLNSPNHTIKWEPGLSAGMETQTNIRVFKWIYAKQNFKVSLLQRKVLLDFNFIFHLNKSISFFFLFFKKMILKGRVQREGKTGDKDPFIFWRFLKIYLKQKDPERKRRQRKRSSICWITPQIAVMASAVTG